MYEPGPHFKEREMTDDKIIDKLNKLKNHAESAEKIGNEEEAHAFASMLQKLLIKHKLSMSDVETSRMESKEPVASHDVDYGKYPDVDVRKTRVRWIIDLARIVAVAHFCRILTWSKSSKISFVGRKTDAEVAEYLFITLQRAIEKIATKEYYRYFYALKNAGDDVKKARGFRAAFIDAFVQRLNQRFEEEKRAAIDSSSTALVRINRADKAAQRWIDDELSSGAIGRSKPLKGNVRSNVAGTQRGKEAADAIDLNANAVKSGASRSKGRLH